MINSPKAWSEILERYGRNGDSILGHMTPSEAELLEKRRAKSKSYKGVSYNPVTGLREFWGGDSPGTAGGGGGEGGDNGVGGPGNGSSGDSVSGFGDHGSLGGAGYSESSIGGYGFGGNTSFSDFANDTSMRAGAPESEISERDGGVNWSEYAMQTPGYKQAGTWGRVAQEIAKPSVVSTGRFSTPTVTDYGILGPMMGFLGGPMMGLAMMGGAALGRAQTPEQQAESMAHNQALGAQNSTGQDRDSSTGLSLKDLMAGADAGVSSTPAPVSTISQFKPEPISQPSQSSWATSPALGVATALAAPFGMPGTLPRFQDYGADMTATGPTEAPDLLQPVKTAAMEPDPAYPGWQPPELQFNSLPTGPTITPPTTPTSTGRDPYLQYLAPVQDDADPMASLRGFRF